MGDKTEFDNYLLKLVDRNDTVGNSLYLYNIHEILRDVWREIIDKNKKISVRKVLPDKLDLEPTHLYAIIKGKRGISIQSTYNLLLLWKQYCKKKEDEIKQIWDKVYKTSTIASFSKSEKLLLPKTLTPDLCYLIGYIVGDGCFDPSGNHYRLKISEKNKEQLETILKPLITEIFGVKCIVKNEGSGRDNSNFLLINSKPIFRFFRNVLEVRVGEIPKIIQNTNAENKRFFLRGIFDSEGSVDPNYLRGKIRIFQKSKAFLQEIIKILKCLGIQTNGPYGPHFKYPSKNFHYFSSWYSIEIRKKSEILKFIEKVGSWHIEKASKMKILSSEIHNRYKYMHSK